MTRHRSTRVCNPFILTVFQVYPLSRLQSKLIRLREALLRRNKLCCKCCWRWCCWSCVRPLIWFCLEAFYVRASRLQSKAIKWGKRMQLLLPVVMLLDLCVTTHCHWFLSNQLFDFARSPLMEERWWCCSWWCCWACVQPILLCYVSRGDRWSQSLDQQLWHKIFNIWSSKDQSSICWDITIIMDCRWQIYPGARSKTASPHLKGFIETHRMVWLFLK